MKALLFVVWLLSSREVTAGTRMSLSIYPEASGGISVCEEHAKVLTAAAQGASAFYCQAVPDERVEPPPVKLGPPRLVKPPMQPTAAPSRGWVPIPTLTALR